MMKTIFTTGRVPQNIFQKALTVRTGVKAGGAEQPQRTALRVRSGESCGPKSTTASRPRSPRGPVQSGLNYVWKLACYSS